MSLRKIAFVLLVGSPLLMLEGCGVNSAPGTAAATGTATGTAVPSGSSQSASALEVQGSLTPGTVGQFYKGAAKVEGGTPAYTWAVSSGKLPVGITLAADTGVLSGVPVATGTASFALTVTDSSTARQQSTQAMSITIAADVTPLTLAAGKLPVGTAGAAYTAKLQAAGGTPGYVWSVLSGTLPPGVTLNASTGVLSGTPNAADTYRFDVEVQDGSSPAEVATASVSVAVSNAASQTTWYVRPDGGTRYSANVLTGQCDGTGDAAYPGKGVNQHCAFNDIRLLWQDGTYAYSWKYASAIATDPAQLFPSVGWVGKGGDTYLVRGSIDSGAAPYRVGWDGLDGNGCTPANAARYQNACFRGFAGDAFYAAPPPLPGTAMQHTRILGENWQSCHARAARTPLVAGWNAEAAFHLSSPYVDVQCFDISDASACKDNCDGQDTALAGIVLENTAAHLSLTDIRIHGMRTFGMSGPSGDGDVFAYLALVGNGGGGWNADAGDGKTGTGSLLVQHYEILWNGCSEEYPIVDTLPYQDCTDQNSGGYGDGFGTSSAVAPAPGWQVHFDQGTVAYNTQDGLDALHLIGSGSSMAVTRTLAYGNMGQQVKVGGAQGTLTDSVIVNNCDALANAMPGTLPGYNAKLSDFCRAGNQAVLMTAGHESTTVIQHNTIAGAGALLIGYVCDTTAGNCDSTARIDLRDNIFLGNPDAQRGDPGANYLMVEDATYTTRGACNAAPDGHHTWLTDGMTACGNNVFFNPGSFNSHNVYFSVKDACSDNNGTGNLCMDPGLQSEIVPLTGYPNLALSTQGGAAFQGGMPLPGLTADFAGTAFHNPPSIGALEQGSNMTPYSAEE